MPDDGVRRTKTCSIIVTAIKCVMLDGNIFSDIEP